jgi:hypothetical protein
MRKGDSDKIMPGKLMRLLTRATLAATLLCTSGASSAHEHPRAESHTTLEPGAKSAADCSDLDVRLEPADDFPTMKCSTGQNGYGEAYSIFSEIAAENATSRIVVVQQYAGTHTYLKPVDSRVLNQDTLDWDVKGSWSVAIASGGFEVRRFFGRPDSATVPCFAFARYAGHVARSTGYQNRVYGFYCEVIASDQPISDVRVTEMIGRIKTGIF